MTYLVTPEMQLKIGDKEYTLSPATECMKKIQHCFKKDILEVMNSCPSMSFDDHAKMIYIAIEDTGEKAPNIELIEQWIVDDCGITTIRNIMQGWLIVITSPKAEREAVAKTVGESLKLLGI